MRGTSKPKLTLMPLVALAVLSLSITVPALSSSVHAAPPVSYATVTVRHGDSLWSLAERKTPTGGDVQSTLDQIVSANHLNGANLAVGQHLHIPK